MINMCRNKCCDSFRCKSLARLGHEHPEQSYASIRCALFHNVHPCFPPTKCKDPKLTADIAALQFHPALEAALHIQNHDLVSAHFLVRHMQGPPAFEGMLLHGVLHRLEGDFGNARAWYSDAKESDVYRKVHGGYGITWKQYKEWERKKEERKAKKADAAREAEKGKEKEEEESGDSDSDEESSDDELKQYFSYRQEYSWDEEPDLDRGQIFLNQMQKYVESGGKEGDEKALWDQNFEEIEAILSFCARKFGTLRIMDASGAWVEPPKEIRQMGQDQVSGNSRFRKFFNNFRRKS